MWTIIRNKRNISIFITISIFVLLFFQVEIDQVLQTYEKIKFLDFIIPSILIIINIVLVCIRFAVLAKRFSNTIPFQHAFIANLEGLFVGLAFFQIVGQTIGRFSLLKKYNVGSSSVAIMSLFEKIMTVLSLLTCILITLPFFADQQTVLDIKESISIKSILVALALCFSVRLLMGNLHQEKYLIKYILKYPFIKPLSEIYLISLLANICLVFAFALIIKAINTEQNLIILCGAAAIISFVSSLPVSVNGWGIREISAIYILGMLGVGEEAALATSIIFGVATTFILLFVYIIYRISTLVRPVIIEEENCNKKGRFLQLEKRNTVLRQVMASLLFGFCAVGIFFQSHFVVGNHTININVADPFAFFAFFVFALYLFEKKKMPLWRLRGVNSWVILTVISFIIAFVIGWSRYGLIEWAYINRLFGLIIILGYLSCGAYFINVVGKKYLPIIIKVMVSCAVGIILFSINSEFLITNSLISGFSINRNAFAIQLICCLILFLIYSREEFFNNIKSYIVSILIISILLSGIYLTYSRAVGLCLIFLLMYFFVFSEKQHRKMFFLCILGAFLISISQVYSYEFKVFIYSILEELGFDLFFIQGLSQYNSQGHQFGLDPARWDSLLDGIKLWLEYPIFGAGLGSFYTTHSFADGAPLLIHNTLIWFLAEFGILGTVIQIVAIGMLLRLAFSKGLWPLEKWRHTLLLLLSIMILISLVHEIYFQRIIWLVLGFCLAVPIDEVVKKETSNTI